MNHRFFVMHEGFGSVRRVLGGVVHGLLWDLAAADVAALDAFEGVAEGLYTKAMHPVMKAVGSTTAPLYLGRSTEDGTPRAGYMDVIVAAARDLAFPDDYIRDLSAWQRRGARGEAFSNDGAERRSGPVPGVTARHATPYDVT